jgi:sugar-specific transcriptional regulator TrmB
MDAKRTITDLGLTENEAKVYLALLEFGRSTIGVIAEKGRLHRTNVFGTIKGLEQKGLVKQVEADGSKFYEATDPDHLLSLIKTKKDRLQRIIPELNLARDLAPKKSEVHVFEGLEAFKSMLNHFLDVGQERLVIGGPGSAYPMLSDFLDLYHKKRSMLKIKMKQIYNADSIARAKTLAKMPYTEVRCLPKEYDAPVSTTICGDEVVISYWNGVPIFIHIKKKKIADSYRCYFDLLWNKAQRVK